MTEAIRTESLGKRYRIGRRERYWSLRDTIATAVSTSVRRFSASLRRRRGIVEDGDDTIWALRDVSLTVGAGEVVGVIGRNGSGKTTLLKILSRVTEPTEGMAEVWGRVGALLEIGVGFHPELTGRENIYLNGAVLGMRRAEIDRKFDEIVDFSGNERFLDTPVKRYSSGMYMRLAFAVAAHLDPEILLVDEVLAVGDIAFQEKCLKKIDEVASTGRTVLFVSHNLAGVRRLCTRTVVLDAGRVRYAGPTEVAIETYLEGLKALLAGGELDALDRKALGSGRVRVVDARVSAANGDTGYLGSEAEAEFRIGYRARGGQTIRSLNVGIVVVDCLGVNVFSCSTGMVGRNFRDLPPAGCVICRVKSLPLIPGTYALHVSLKDEEGQADYVYNATGFTVINQGDSELMDHPGPKWGSVAVSPRWSWEDGEISR